MADETTPLTQAYQAYERLEGQLSVALDKLVTTNGFADLLATSATNVMAMTRLANGTIDKFVRSTRLAARRDVTELARQLARTEAKLERVLQVVEELQEQLDAASEEAARSAVPSATSPAQPTTPTRAVRAGGSAPSPATSARNGSSAKAKASTASQQAEGT